VLVGSALIALLVVAAGTVLISQRIARADAIEDAAAATDRLADLLIGPLLADVQAGVPGSLDELDRLVDNRLADEAITEMVVWNPDGTVEYSSDRTQIGQQFEPSEELLAAAAGEIVAEVDDEPEASYRGSTTGSIVEVYAPIADTDPPLVLEAYFSYATVQDEAARLRAEIIPMVLGALLILQLVQVPIAVSMARRLHRHDADRTALVERNLAASDRERRAIAADLHDGPVQDLAGVSYALSALRTAVPPEKQPVIERLVGSVRDAVHSLRRVMVDVYPPDLSSAGLTAAIDSLTEPLRAQDVQVTISDGPPQDLDSQATAVLYRTAKEVLANVARHAGARNVWIELTADALDGRSAARLEIADDGVGFPDTALDRRAEGHLGLRLIRDRIADVDGTVEFSRRAGGGAVVTAVIPRNSAQ
jgi:two-component system, NarL family, sensor kinase